MILDTRYEGIKAFRLQSEEMNPTLHNVEFDYVTNEAMVVSVDMPMQMRYETERAKIMTLAIKSKRYKFALDRDLQELVDILVEVKTNELASALKNSKVYTSNLRDLLALERSKTCHDRFIDWLEKHPWVHYIGRVFNG